VEADYVEYSSIGSSQRDRPCDHGRSRQRPLGQVGWRPPIYRYVPPPPPAYYVPPPWVIYAPPPVAYPRPPPVYRPGFSIGFGFR
jgi:hypothetical protein